MSQPSLNSRFGSGARFAALLCLTLGSIGAATSAAAKAALQAGPQNAQKTSTASGGMAGMAAHMYMTTLRPLQPGDRQKAAAIVADAKQAMAPYQDYRKALADGYHIFLPNVPQPLYHFTNRENAIEAQTYFDPLKPTSLLYRKTPDGGYKLIGVMYTDRVTASEEEINSRVPLSIARWHQHVNFCRAPLGKIGESFGPHPEFGALGSINTREACNAAGGTFYPHVFGWMVHVYPYETDPKKIWSVDDDDQGHDNMDRSSMPGMQMP